MIRARRVWSRATAGRAAVSRTCHVPSSTSRCWVRFPLHAVTARVLLGGALRRGSLGPTRLARLGVGELVPLQPLFTHAIASCADASEWKTGIELLRELERSGRVVSPSVYTEAIRGCGEGGDWSAAVALLHRARGRGDMAGSRSVTVGMYASAISACDAAGKHDEALQLYKLGFDAKCFDHWHKDEAFSIDLHGFTQSCAVCAVRHVITHEVGNFIPSDLKIITGAGKHSDGGVSLLGPRIEKLLSRELSPPLAYERAQRLHCDTDGCHVIRNDGCLVVSVQELFKWLVDAKPYESYYINLPAPGTA